MEPIALIAFLLLLASGGGSGSPSTPKPLPLPKLPPIPKPKPKEPVVPGIAPPKLPKPEPEPADLPVSGNSLSVSPDCKDAIVGKTWLVSFAIPRLKELAAAGIGLPVYTEEQADRSMDAAVRTVLSESSGGAACIDNIPWLDRYVKTNPVPMPQEGESLMDYMLTMQAWDDAWELQLKQWVQGHPKLAAKVLGPLYTSAALTFVGTNNIDINYGANGPLTSGMTAAEGELLRGLGYSMYDGVVDNFQVQYNMVRDYLSNGQWTVMGWAIDEDNQMGPQTRHAMQMALGMTGPNRSWPAVVFSALNG